MDHTSAWATASGFIQRLQKLTSSSALQTLATWIELCHQKVKRKRKNKNKREKEKIKEITCQKEIQRSTCWMQGRNQSTFKEKKKKRGKKPAIEKYHMLALKALNKPLPSSPPFPWSSTFSALSRISSISILKSLFLLSSSFLSSLNSSSAPNLNIAESSFCGHYKCKTISLMEHFKIANKTTKKNHKKRKIFKKYSGLSKEDT